MVTETLTHEGNELHMGTELLEVETPTAVPPVDTAGVRTKSLKDCGVLGPMKYIRLGQDQDDWFPSIGGEAREVLEQIGNDNWASVVRTYRRGGLTAVLERLSRREVHALFRRPLWQARPHVCRDEERREFLPDWRPAADRRKETRVPCGLSWRSAVLGGWQNCLAGARGQG